MRPFFEVLPRKYRFRILNASVSRCWKLALADASGRAVPFQFIANDGNLVVNPIRLTTLDQQGNGERYDIVVDFSAFRIGDRITLVNRLKMRDDGRGPKEELSLAEALQGDSDDPVIGPILEFRVVDQVESVDVPGVIHRATDARPERGAERPDRADPCRYPGEEKGLRGRTVGGWRLARAKR